MNMSTETRSRDVRYPLGVVGLIIVAFLLRAGFGLLADMLVAGSVSWVPRFGTIGQTVVVYSWRVSLFAFVFVPVVAFWLGKRYGQKEK